MNLKPIIARAGVALVSLCFSSALVFGEKPAPPENYPTHYYFHDCIASEAVCESVAQQFADDLDAGDTDADLEGIICVDISWSDGATTYEGWMYD